MATGPVLVAYDGSSHSQQGLEVVSDVVADSRDVVVLTVWQSVATQLTEGGSFGVTAGFSDADLDTVEEAEADRLAAEAAQVLRDNGRTAEARTAEATEAVWIEIVKIADELDASLIVTGSRGRGAVKSLLLGSVSSELLSRSKRPVLIAPPHQDAPRDASRASSETALANPGS